MSDKVAATIQNFISGIGIFRAQGQFRLASTFLPALLAAVLVSIPAAESAAQSTGGDDHGDDRATATTVTIPSTTNGGLDSGDQDWFRIDVIESGTLRLTTEGSVDTYGELYDGAGLKIDEDDDGGAGQNFRIERRSLAVGTYYLKVTGYNSSSIGGYTLRITGAARSGSGGNSGNGGGNGGNGGNPGNTGDDHGNDQASATVVAVPSTSNGELERGDRDWFRINVGQGGSLRLETRGSVDTYGEFYNSSGTKIDENDDNGTGRNFRIERNSLGAGTYYLKVRGYSDSNTGSYTLAVSGSAGGGTSGGNPDLAVESASVSNAAPASGASFTLRATVRNRGNASSAATTLRYYRSTDATITSSDSQVGTDAVRALSAGATSPETITLTAPAQPGTFYFGACVDAVTGETVNGNNCSTGVQIVVPDSGSGGNGGNTGNTGDDHGNDQASATVVAIPSTSNGELGRGDRDWFRINVGQGGSLRLETRGSVDTYGEFYNSSGTKIDENDDSGTGRNFRIERNSLAAGIYYLKVRGYSDSNTGNYTLAVSGSAGGGTSGGNPDLAVESASVSNAAPASGASFILGAIVRNRGNASSAATNLRYYRSTDATIGSADTRVGIDAVSALAAGRTSVESITLSAPAQPGTYFYGACVDPVSGESANGNNCSTGVQVVVPDSGNGGGTGGGGDDHGDNRAAATVVAIPSTSNGELSSGDYDWFRLNVGQGGSLRLETTGSVDTYGELHDSSGTKIDENDDSGASRNFRIERSSLAAGTYYLKVRGFSSSSTGSYTLEVSGSTGGGTSSGSPDLAVESASVSNAAPAAGESFILSAIVRNRGNASSAATTLRYYRSADATISATDTRVGTDVVSALGANRASQESISLTAPAQPGTYYFGACVDTVTGETAHGNNCSTGVSVVVPDSGDNGGNGGNTGNTGDDHGNDQASATVVAIPSTSNGELERGDRDWFRINVGQGGSLRLETTGSVDTYGELYDGAGAKIDENDDSGFGPNFLIETSSLDAGAYYLKVRGYSRLNTGNYTLTIVAGAGSGNGSTRGAPTVSITGGDAITEGGAARFTVTAIPAPTSNLTVNLRVSENGNFAESFEIGSKTVTVYLDRNDLSSASALWRVATRDDRSPEGDGSVTVTVVDGDGYAVGSASSATVAVSDNDAGRVQPPLEPILDPHSSLSPARIEYHYGPGADFGIHVGHSPELYGGESLRMIFMHAPSGNTFYDEIDFSWSVRGGGSIVSVPGRGLNDRLVAYRAPANVTREFTATVTSTVTVRGKGLIARYGSSDSLEVTLDLTVRPNAAAPTRDLRGPTSERGDAYADGYVFWNGGQDVSFEHNPWINTTPGRTITWSFPENPFSRNGQDVLPLRSELDQEARAVGWRYSTGAHRELFQQAFAHWEQYLNVHFQEVDDDPNADWVIGYDPAAAVGVLAQTYPGGGDTDAVLITAGRHFNDAGRRYEPEGALHEIGHALGLGHPHTQGAGANLDDAIMEYEEHDRAPLSNRSYKSLQFPADIIGAQHIWGKATGAPRTAPDVPRTVTLAYDSNRNELVADWGNVLINGGTPVTGWIVDWLKNSDPARTNSPDAGAKVQRVDTITRPSTRTATFASPGAGDWSVQIRAINAVGTGLRKRGPATGPGLNVAVTSTSSVEAPPSGAASEVGSADLGNAANPTPGRWRPAGARIPGLAPGSVSGTVTVLPRFGDGVCISPQLRAEAAGRSREIWRGQAHVESWLRVTQTFTGTAGDAAIVTPAEAHFYAAAGLEHWLPVAAALNCLETEALREAQPR